LATCVLPELIAKGLELKANTVATRLITEDNVVAQVECHEKPTGQKHYYRARTFILAAGTLGSPHLLLASDLQRFNPAGHVVGHFLMRHCNAIVFGFFPRRPNRARQFHKQLGIHDFYFGHPTIKKPFGKLGSMQQLHTPPVGLVQANLPKPLGHLLSPAVDHLTGLLVMAEDQPQYHNHVAVDRSRTDDFGLPQLTITHHYTERDVAACDALIKKARQILRRAGATFFYIHKIKTFSHAVGSVRMGNDPKTSALDEFCRFRGLANLFVVDGSFMPTSAGLNPSLTISANALRVGEHIVDT
jgi:choline dehydrogenase-like flavoprotein